VSEHDPDGAEPLQDWPPPLTVTVPDGVRVSPGGGAAEKETVTGCPTSAVLGDTDVMVVVVSAFMPVPVSCPDWVDPATPPSSSVKVSAPPSEPLSIGAK